MKLRTKIITAAAALSAATVLGVGAIANTTSKVFADGAHTYSCVDITMTETVSNPSSYKTTNAETFSVLHGIAEGELSTTWTNANYKASANGSPTSAIKIGGSSGKYDGSVVLSFKTYEVSRIIVYAAGWNGDKAPNLTMGSKHYTLPATADNAYSFQPYTFDFDATSTITLTNGSGNTSSHRVVVSKIVFKVTGATTPIDSSTSAETTGEPEDTTTEPEGTSQSGEQQLITFTKSELAGSSPITHDGVTITNSSDYGSNVVTELRIYKGNTMTISGSNITQIVLTCTANGTTKQGPGCFGAGAPTGYTFESAGKIGTWTGAADSVSFTATDNQVRITQIEVTLN